VKGFTAILGLLGDGEKDGVKLKGSHKVLRAAVLSYVRIYKTAVDREKLKKLLRKAIKEAPRDQTAKRKDHVEEYLDDKTKRLDDIIDSAIKKCVEPPGGIKLEYFVAYSDTHSYIYLPLGTSWPASSVDDRLPSVALLARNGQP